ncbi:hypothetical protein P8452_57075 [Trifolium repens]|nr:hypothetical protein P8452_57075 [Trifolium repens]
MFRIKSILCTKKIASNFACRSRFTRRRNEICNISDVVCSIYCSNFITVVPPNTFRRRRKLLKLVGNIKTDKHQHQYSKKFENEVPSDLY